MWQKKSKNIPVHAMTTGYIAMNQMLRERYQGQVGLSKMNKFIGTWRAYTAMVKYNFCLMSCVESMSFIQGHSKAASTYI